MTSQDEPGRGQETPEERAPGLTAALRRIGASLDLETVLNEVVESARALTGARAFEAAPRTTLSSPSRRRNSSPGSGRRYAGARRPGS